MIETPKISEAEWRVMQQLWKTSPATANDLVNRLSEHESWKPTTIKTLINRLVQKKAIGFTRQGREHLYHPLIQENDIIRKESRHFLNRFFGGALKPMLASLVDNQDLSDKEIEELKEILNKASQKKS